MTNTIPVIKVENEPTEEVYEFYRDPEGAYIVTEYAYPHWGDVLFVIHHATLTETSGCRHVRRESMSVENGWLRVPAPFVEAVWEQLRSMRTWGTLTEPHWRNQPRYQGVLFCSDCMTNRYQESR